MRLMLATLLLLPAIAVADPTPDVTKMTKDDCAAARKANKTCVLSIEDEKIEGGRPSAGESTIVVQPFVDHSSLIRIRRDFIPEILKTAEDL
jgi:hypothetical protein